jgi:hypothetical protein
MRFMTILQHIKSSLVTEIPLGDGPTFMDAKVEALKNINALAREVARLKENGNNSGNSTDNDPKGS